MEWNYPFLNIGKIIRDYLKEIVIKITEKQIQLKDNNELKKMKKVHIVAIVDKIKEEKKNKKSLQNILWNFLNPQLDSKPDSKWVPGLDRFIQQFQKKGILDKQIIFKKI